MGWNCFRRCRSQAVLAGTSTGSLSNIRARDRRAEISSRRREADKAPSWSCPGKVEGLLIT
uniref:Uncharacterized protein n=1 Tax=uncultured Rhodospirillales bacterium HF4000_24M03 TaxID=710788 RepID=E0XW33_9PROT|nr:hypothetical protein [uncultured Rhodospirillales bacterium HF4000_24M03]